MVSGDEVALRCLRGAFFCLFDLLTHRGAVWEKSMALMTSRDSDSILVHLFDLPLFETVVDLMKNTTGGRSTFIKEKKSEEHKIMCFFSSLRGSGAVCVG